MCGILDHLSLLGNNFNFILENKKIVKYLNLSIVKKEDFKRKGWMYEFIKEIYNQPVKHDIFEMTNIKSFEIEEELKKYSIKKEKYILNWLNVIQEN